MSKKVSSPGPRKHLWYVAFLVVLPAWGYELGTGILPLALIGLPAFLESVYAFAVAHWQEVRTA